MITIQWSDFATRRNPEGGDDVELEFQTLYIDGAATEQYDITAELSSHPVEDGVDVSDHVHLNPDRLTLECVVSDHPTDPAIEDDENRPQVVYDTIRDLVRGATPVDIEVSLGLLEQ